MKKGIMLVITMALLKVSFAYPHEESTLNFTIYRSKKAIGSLKVTSRKCVQGFKLNLSSQIQTQVVFDLNISVFIENIMGPDLLIHSYSERKINGSTKIKNTLALKNDTYLYQGRQEANSTLPDKILFTSTILYFREPIGIHQLYAENFNCMVPIKQIGSHIYLLQLPDGKYSTFYYEKGILVKMISKTMFGEVLIQKSV